MGQNDDLIIRFSGLKPGKYSYGFTLTDEFFEAQENDEINGGQVQVKVEMERFEHMLMLTFALKGEVTTFCDRCLGSMTLPVEGKESLCVRFSDTETSDDENVAVLPEDAFEMDLTQWLYEYVAVRIPLQHVHPDGECDPAVTRYIVDKESEQHDSDDIDPRWEALKDLK